MTSSPGNRFFWAFLSACFAALTAIFAKIGIRGVDSESKVAPVDKFSLVFVALFAFAFLGERPSLKDWLGIGLVAVGVLTLAIRR